MQFSFSKDLHGIKNTKERRKTTLFLRLISLYQNKIVVIINVFIPKPFQIVNRPSSIIYKCIKKNKISDKDMKDKH